MYFGKLWWDRRMPVPPIRWSRILFHGFQSKNTSPELRIGPTKSRFLSRPSGPMPLDRMWIGLEIIAQMGLFVNNTAS